MADCSCDKCVALCENPGWFAPAEAKAAIDAGYADRLMLDYWVRASGSIYILSPASKGHEGKRAPNTEELFGHMPPWMARLAANTTVKKGRCTFLVQGRCEIHASGFKPIECRGAMGCDSAAGIENGEVAKLWDNAEAKALVREWMKVVGLTDKVFEECW